MPESIRRRKPLIKSDSKRPLGRSAITDQLIDSAMRAESGSPLAEAGERRRVKRVPYPAWVALLLVSPEGDRGRPIALRSKDISLHGIRVVSRNMIYPGSQGVMQLMRSDGRLALVGIVVRTSRYSGNMEHQTGLQFGPLPRGWVPEEFVDRRGHMHLLHPKLRENLEID